MEFELTYRDIKTLPSWLVGATTFAMDRIVPEVELIHQTAADRGSGLIRITRSETPANSGSVTSGSRLNRWKDRLKAKDPIEVTEGYFIDLRMEPYFNWSNHVNKYLLYALLCREKFRTDPVVIIPGYMPRILHDLYDVFGFRIISTNGVVCGREIRIHDWESIKIESARSQIVAALDYDFSQAIRQSSSGRTFRKVFLDRRDTRTIENGAEITAFLHGLGFETVFPETLSAADQMRLWLDATDIVSIHGAGMAPLQFRTAAQPPLRLVEIMPVGHMTRFFCAMCHDVGGHYVGVRGRLKSRYCDDLYRFGEPFYAESLNSFEVDLRSLQVGLHLVNGGAVQDRLPSRWNLTYAI